MGVITRLIQANQEKKDADLDRNLKLWRTIASLPNAGPEVQQAAFQNIGTLAGGALGLPKQHHGVFGGLLHGISQLNPVPGDQSEGKLQPIPQAGPAGPSQLADEHGQTLPSAPAYSPWLNEEQMRTKATRYADEDATRAMTLDQKKQTQVTEFRRQTMITAGVDPKSPAGQDYMLSGKLPLHFGDPTAARAKTTRIEVNGKWVDALVHPDGTHTTLSGEEIEPETITNANAKAEPMTPTERQSYHLTELRTAVRALHPDWPKEKQESWVAQRIIAENNNKITTGSLHIAGQQQNQAVTALDSGVGAGRGGSGIPADPTGAPSAPSATHTAPTSAAPLPDGTGIVKLPRASVSGVGTTGAGAGADASAAGGAQAGPSPAKMAYLEQHDQDIATFMSNLSGIVTGGRGKGQNIRAMRGRAKVLALIPGSSIESISAEKTMRDAARKAIAKRVDGLEAYNVIAKQVDNLGVQLQQARAKFPDNSPAWQKIKTHIAQNFTGDPDTAALVTAANEFQRIYGRFSAGAGQSNAQTNVSAQGKTDEVVNAFQTGASIDAVIEQVQKGAANDLHAILSALKDGQKGLAKPWGTFTADDLVPDINPNPNATTGGSKGSDGKPLKREQQSDRGAFRYTLDGGKTWKMGHLPDNKK